MRPRPAARHGGSTGLSLRLGALVLAASALLGACTNLPAAGRATRVASRVTSSPPAPAPSLPTVNPYDPSGDPVVDVVEKVAPAVVNVTTRTVSRDALLGGTVDRAVGTGFMIRSDGVVVTNFHVVEGAVNIKVTLPPPDERTFSARVIGGNSDHDLAILQLQGDTDDLPTIPLGNSSDVSLGQRVIALGYALALPGGPTVTSGIISSLERTVQAEDPNGGENGEGITRTYEDVLQTDAAINPGNSGGPLVDLAGNVVGINTAGAGEAENVGFSIAIDAARPYIDRAMRNPAAPVAYLGVSTTPVTPSVASQFDLPVEQGAYVLSSSPGGPAESAGIREGDIIVEFGGKPVDGSDELGRLILARNPGDKVTVGLVRPDGERESVTATLGVRPLP